MEFGLYELLGYVNAEKNLQRVDQECMDRREELLSSTYPFYVYDNGDQLRKQYSVETIALELASIDEQKEKIKQRLQAKVERLERALDLLNDWELKAFEIRFYGCENVMNTSSYGKHLKRAIKKVSEYLLEEKEKELQAIEDKRKEQIRQFREQNKRLMGAI